VQAARFADALKHAERPQQRQQQQVVAKLSNKRTAPRPASTLNASAAQFDPRAIPRMPPDEHAGDTKDATIQNMRARIAELEAEAHYVRDLHLLAPCVTSYYTMVFRNVRADYRRRGQSFPYSSWVDLFTAATNETTRFDRFEGDEKQLTNNMARVMSAMGGVTMEQWAELQELRRIRNEMSHPRINDTEVNRVIRERWTRHSAGDALRNIVNYLATQGGIIRRHGSAPHHRLRRHVYSDGGPRTGNGNFSSIRQSSN
jgi:hypothetical protein